MQVIKYIISHDLEEKVVSFTRTCYFWCGPVMETQLSSMSLPSESQNIYIIYLVTYIATNCICIHKMKCNLNQIWQVKFTNVITNYNIWIDFPYKILQKTEKSSAPLIINKEYNIFFKCIYSNKVNKLHKHYPPSQ